MLAAIALAGARVKGASWPDVGIRSPDAVVLITVATMTVALFVKLRMPLGKRIEQQVKSLVKLAGPVLPRTATERRWFVALSFSAGIGEELLCRGFLFFYLGFYFKGLEPAWIVAISSVIFGMAHAYQGLRGVFLTTMVGAFLGTLYVVTSMLWVPMAVHTMIDLRVPLLLSRANVRDLVEAEMVREGLKPG
jgi:membrane protease YdiL (CAAX protease family)